MNTPRKPPTVPVWGPSPGPNPMPRFSNVDFSGQLCHAPARNMLTPPGVPEGGAMASCICAHCEDLLRCAEEEAEEDLLFKASSKKLELVPELISGAV